MLRALYTSATAMIKDMTRQDVVANNLANSATIGYKRDLAVSSSFDDQLIIRENDPVGPEKLSIDPKPVIGKLGFGTRVDTVATIYETGALKQTDNETDVAIVDHKDTANPAEQTTDFFAVKTASGIRYTRDGSFSLQPTQNGTRILTTDVGDPVLGTTGQPIELPQGKVNISQDGTVEVNGENVDQLQIVGFQTAQLQKDPTLLKKEGGNLFVYGGTGTPQADANPDVKQGFLETSNVNTVRKMVEMITVMRSYEANSKIIQSLDSTLDRTANDVGKV